MPTRVPTLMSPNLENKEKSTETESVLSAEMYLPVHFSHRQSGTGTWGGGGGGGGGGENDTLKHNSTVEGSIHDTDMRRCWF